ncbi:Protein transport protein Sec24C [Clonorchis sinensis]|uniref:Protein transport protein Sec24C n=1 Tax=Clonorchis sinensis TaxID=79923 RepID=A0A8T1N0D4_CLOSI|nr:Protein transport protein Sec24C [Clonorchis sinensis]
MFPPQYPSQPLPPHGGVAGARPWELQTAPDGFHVQESTNGRYFPHPSGPPLPPVPPPIDKFAAMNLGHQVPPGQQPLDQMNYGAPPYYQHETPSAFPQHPPTVPPSQTPYYPPPSGQAAPSTHYTPSMPPIMSPPVPPQPPGPNVAQPGTVESPMPRYPQYPPSAALGSKSLPPGVQPQYLNGPPAAPTQPTKRISAEGLPSAVEVIESNRTQCSGPFFTNQRSVLPPLVTTDFSCRDEGNCNPRFIRSSLYAVPTTSDLMKTVGIPFTLTISPFASLHADDQPIVVSDMGEQGPVRCMRCRAYMNPFASFIDGGRRFQCSLCGGVTEVPVNYFAHLDHTGRRTDTYHRPELCLGSYELTATAEYCKNNELPSPPAFLFLLDVSQTSIRSGLVQLFCSQFVERILPKLPRDDNAPESASGIRVGFMTYDHQLHFYSLAPETACNGTTEGSTHHADVYVKPQMHIVADVEDVFVPTIEGFLVPPEASSISSLLSLIPVQFSSNAASSPPDAMLGPAIQAGLETLRAANRPGKLFVFHSNLPTAEAPGKLKNRDDRRLVGTEKEKSMLVPAGDFYTGLGQLCVEAGCSVDLFLFPNAYTDVATLAEIPRLTSGHLYKYNCFQADLQSEHFLSDLERAVSRPKAFNAVMRVRTSTGIRPVEFFGNFNLPNTTDIELACVDPDIAVTVEIRHDDKLQDKDVAFIQVACLFTSLSGQRRLRIHNLSLATTSSIPEIFRIAELDTHMNWLSKFAMRALCTRAHPHVVDDLTARTAHTLAAYRRHCSGGPGDVGASPGELVLPQNMKLYPLYVQCLMKSDAFMPADNISIDERALLMFYVNGMDVKQSNSYLYPRLFPVHTLAPNFEGQLVYPPASIRCSYEWLQPDGAFLLDNGVNLFLWLGSNLPAEWIQSVFNVPSARQFEPERVYDLPRLETDVSRNLSYLIHRIHEEHGRHTRLLVIRPGDKLEACFKRFLVEDRHSGNSVSYVEYLCHIHKEVCGLLR